MTMEMPTVFERMCKILGLDDQKMVRKITITMDRDSDDAVIAEIERYVRPSEVESLAKHAIAIER